MSKKHNDGSSELEVTGKRRSGARIRMKRSKYVRGKVYIQEIPGVSSRFSHPGRARIHRSAQAGREEQKERQRSKRERHSGLSEHALARTFVSLFHRREGQRCSLYLIFFARCKKRREWERIRRRWASSSSHFTPVHSTAHSHVLFAPLLLLFFAPPFLLHVFYSYILRSFFTALNAAISISRLYSLVLLLLWQTLFCPFPKINLYFHTAKFSMA